MQFRKIRKFIKSPGLFFRDYFNKKYPVINTEQRLNEEDEYAIIKNQTNLQVLESSVKFSREVPVDAVFTWVNDQDPAWQAKFAHFSKRSTQDVALFGKDKARFSNHNELFYSLHSVRTYLPWIRKIFIVTDNQVPQWFTPSDNIVIVDHKAIIDSEYLPTFNSHVIEANLHKIPDLSENFIYFNDDVFVARPLLKEHFFRNNGIASIFISNKSLNAMLKKGVITPTLSASLNARALLRIHYGSEIDIPLVHTYVPLKKSAYLKAWDTFFEEIHAFLPNRFRGKEDMNLATFLVPWIMYLEGKSVSSREICYYFNIRSPNALTHYKKLLTQNTNGTQPHSFCANDFNSEKSIPDYHHKLEKMLSDYYSIG